MGKGGYIGGGTIIGPRTPEWFGQGVEDPVDLDKDHAKKQEKAEAQIKRPPGKLTRNQRRKLARDRFKAKQNRKPEKPQKAVERKPLTASAEARIAKLRLHIKGLEQQIASCEQTLQSSRAELDGVMKEYGLPLDGPNKKQGN